jgi:hypothetical protein
MGKHEIRTEVVIRATPARIWAILVDFAAHSQWNPFVKRIQGEPKPGSKLTVSVQPEGGKGMTFRPIVLAAVPNQELRWLGRLLVPGLFDGEHYFLIQRIDAETSRFIHGEVFSGLLVSLFQSSLDAGTKGGFVAMNHALKKRAELPSQV